MYKSSKGIKQDLALLACEENNADRLYDERNLGMVLCSLLNGERAVKLFEVKA